MQLPTTRDELPIREDDTDANRARQALMLAQIHGLLLYTSPYDLSDPRQVEALQFELGAEAQLPVDDRVYALVYVPTDAGGDPVPSLIPEEHAPAVAYALALRKDPVNLAPAFLYRLGILPVG